jgi:hypothetical protein
MSNARKLLEDKLYAHQAIQDSVKVTDAEVKAIGRQGKLHGGPNRFYGKVINTTIKVQKKNLEALIF